MSILFRKLLFLTIPLSLFFTASSFADAISAEKNLHKIKLPKGFKIEIYAEVLGPRSMVLGQSTGAVFVGTVGDTVYGLVDKDKDRKADQVVPMMTGLKAPNGLAMHQGFLYVAEPHRISRYAGVGFGLDLPWDQMREDVYEDERLPKGFSHSMRYIAFGPDNKLYMAVGAPCNICDVKDLAGTIIRMDSSGDNAEVFAQGVRNAVGLDFHPNTGVLHFPDNGVDLMGDDVPAGEVNAAPEMGMHFGFPYYAGGREQHADWKDKKPPQNVTFPAVELGAHGAPLGLKFYTGDMFPKKYKNDAFVAQHGSWNRSEPFGYRIMRIKFDKKGNMIGKEPFAEGWLNDGEAWGRPVDLLQLADGSLLVSDNYQDVIYRISYK